MFLQDETNICSQTSLEKGDLNVRDMCIIFYPLLLTGHLSIRANAVLDTVALMVSR